MDLGQALRETRERLKELPDIISKVVESEVALVSERTRLIATRDRQIREREKTSAGAFSELVTDDKNTPKGVVDGVLKLKATEGSLMQLNDSIEKLGAAITQSQKEKRAFTREQNNLAAKLEKLEAEKSVAQMVKDFEQFKNAWFMAEQRWDECKNTNQRINQKYGYQFLYDCIDRQCSDPDRAKLLKHVISYWSKPNMMEFMSELSPKSLDGANLFYSFGGKRQVRHRQSEFKKDHAFTGFHY